MGIGYPKFPKIPRWDRDIVISEKIDGQNALVAILPIADAISENPTYAEPPLTFAHGMALWAGSRSGWLQLNADEAGFAEWVVTNARELVNLGPGRHYGEWYGKGIGRGYGLSDRRFMLFNAERWWDKNVRPECCEVATVLYGTNGRELNDTLSMAMYSLKGYGSAHVPGFKPAEGVVLWHKAGNHLYKACFEADLTRTDDGNVVRPMAGGREHPVPVRSWADEFKRIVEPFKPVQLVGVGV